MLRSGTKKRRGAVPDDRSAAKRAAFGSLPTIEGYTDLSIVGHGASATVYRAVQDGFDRAVAIKVLNVDISDRRAQKRFHRERALNGRLSSHPNVVTVLDSGFVDGRYPYLAMELLDQGSLTDRMAERGPFDIELALHIGIRIAGALESAHQIGILHRDVKPQNILLSRFGEPALADFGIAAILEMEHSLTAALTPVHAAPEVLEGAEPNALADVYALGSTIYTMLAGTPPFAGVPGEGMLAQLLRITTSDLPAMARSDVPRQVVDVLRQSMAKQPGDRVPSAGEFGAALQRVQRELAMPVTTLPVEDVSTAVTPDRPEAVASDAAPANAFDPPALDATMAPPPPPPAAADPPLPVAYGASPRAAPLTPAAPPDRIPRTPEVVWSRDFDGTIDHVPAEAAVEPGVGVPTDAPTVIGRQRHQLVVPDQPKRRRWLLPAIGAAALAVGIGTTVAVSALTDDDASATPTTVTGTLVTLPSDLSVLAPIGVEASTDGGVVLVTWRSRTGSDVQHVVNVYREGDGVPDIQVAAPGVESLVIVGVGAADPACFTVAALLAFGETRSDPATTAVSDVACINGAVAQPG